MIQDAIEYNPTDPRYYWIIIQQIQDLSNITQPIQDDIEYIQPIQDAIE